jgi:hypothetical protein
MIVSSEKIPFFRIVCNHQFVIFLWSHGSSAVHFGLAHLPIPAGWLLKPAQGECPSAGG